MNTRSQTRTHCFPRTRSVALVVSLTAVLAGCSSNPPQEAAPPTTTITPTAAPTSTAPTSTAPTSTAEPTLPTTSAHDDPMTTEATSEATSERPDLATIAAESVATYDLPALAIAHIGPAGVVDVAVAGHRSHDSDVILAEDAPFHLGSDTKAMTAVLLATYVQDQQLDLDASLSTLLPDLPIDERIAAASLRDVLGHRAGLTDEVLDGAALFAATDARAARADAVADALVAPGASIGEFVYANVNYMLAGLVAERIAGDSWEQLITTRVFEPLNMACGFGAPIGPDVPLGHTATGEVVPEDAPVTDNPPAFGPAGTVHCSMGDWAKFTAAVLAGLQGRDTAVLDATTVEDLFNDDHDYVAGWSRISVDGDTIYAHDGSNTVWYARAILILIVTKRCSSLPTPEKPRRSRRWTPSPNNSSNHEPPGSDRLPEPARTPSAACAPRFAAG